MKKREKRIYVLNAIRDAIDDYFAKHPTYCSEYCNNCTESTCMGGKRIFITVFDKNHKRISGNYYNNCQFWWDPSSSKIINDIAYDLNIDINHFMWGSEDKYLHKVRYIKIGSRTDTTTADGEGITRESGREYDLFQYTCKYYNNSWNYL